MKTRIYLTGAITVESDGKPVVRDADFRGRQSRLAFAYLACERQRAVSRHELCEVLWGEDPPPAIDSALSAIISRLRKLIADRAPDGIALESSAGAVRMRTGGAWLDVDSVAEAVDRAEAALKRGDRRAAFGPANVVLNIARRPFLPADGSAWPAAQRDQLRRSLQRALECLATIWLASGEPELAVENAGQAVALDPPRESSYRLLMEAHVAGGNRPEALRVYHQLRSRLASELGINPSSETEKLYIQLLG